MSQPLKAGSILPSCLIFSAGRPSAGRCGKPDLIGPFGNEVLIDPVGGDRKIVMAVGGAYPEPPRRPCPYAVITHETFDNQAINVFFYSGIGNLVDGLIFAKHIYLIISRAGWTGAKRKIEGGKIDLNPSLLKDIFNGR
jgi:hypothetical protein